MESQELKHRLGPENFKKRRLIEDGYRKSFVKFGRWDIHFNYMLKIMKSAELCVKVSGLWKRGVRNSLEYEVNDRRWFFPNLPKAFEGFRILHLSDLHIDGVPDRGTALKKKVEALEADMLVITGDFRYEPHKGTEAMVSVMREFLKGLHYPHGICGILGNHDAIDMVEPLEKTGLRFLLNESLEIRKDGESFRLIGVDDPHFYQLHDLERAFRNVPPGAFKLLLAHSGEIAHAASEIGADFYLCGHSHGGQICLPGGVPVIGNSRSARKYFKGAWTYGRMQGYTSSGTGTSGVPVRFFSRPEIVVHRFFLPSSKSI